MAKEIQHGWFSEAFSFPPFIPFRVLPGSILEKLEGGFQLFWDASWPHPASAFCSLRLKSGEYLAPDANTFATIPKNFQFKWASIEAIGEILAAFQTAARSAGLHTYARTYDMAKWFRQLAAALAEWWKALIFTDEGYRYDRRVQMGRTIAAHHGHRLALLIAEIIEERAEKED